MAHLDTGIAYIPAFVVNFVLKASTRCRDLRLASVLLCLHLHPRWRCGNVGFQSHEKEITNELVVCRQCACVSLVLKGRFFYRQAHCHAAACSASTFTCQSPWCEL